MVIEPRVTLAMQTAARELGWRRGVVSLIAYWLAPGTGGFRAWCSAAERATPTPITWSARSSDGIVMHDFPNETEALVFAMGLPPGTLNAVEAPQQ